jgi:putative aldouronate transport system substrate-binding protein
MQMDKNKGTWNRLAALLSIVSLLTATACSNSSSSQPGAANPAQTDKEIKIKMIAAYYSIEPPKPDTEELKLIESYTHAKLDITWIPNASYQDKLNVTIASGELPDILIVQGDRTSSIVNAVQSGMFWEIGSYLKDYSNLKQRNEVLVKNTSYYGKIYGIYRERPLTRSGFVVRKDWLKKLGLEEPKTLDDLYKVLRAFAYNDPDGNGKQDTYGLANLVSWEYFLGVFGGPNKWDVQNGKLVPDFMTKEYLDTIKFLKKLYDEKILVQDFAVASSIAQRDDNVNKNKAGLYTGSIDDSLRHGDLTKIVPDAEIDVFTKVEGPKGVRIMPQSGYNGLYMFPKKSVKDEARLKELLTFINKMSDEKMATLIQWGLEGKHYTLKDSKAMQTPEQEKVFSDHNYDYWQLTASKKNAISGIQSPLATKVFKMMDDNEPAALVDPAASLLSETYIKKGTELTKFIDDSRTKYILGQIDDAGWSKVIEQWRERGGEQIVKEYNEQYTKANQK